MARPASPTPTDSERAILEVLWKRKHASVREVTGADGLSVASNELLRPGPDGRGVPAAPPSTGLLDRLGRHGFDPFLLEQARTDPNGGWVR